MTNRQYNIYAPVSVLSPGANSGSVTQSNSATNSAVAGNSNVTFQGVEQAQAGSGHSRRGAQRQYAALYNGTSQSANAGVYNGPGTTSTHRCTSTARARAAATSPSRTRRRTPPRRATPTSPTRRRRRVRRPAARAAVRTRRPSSPTARASRRTPRVYNGQYNIYAPVYVHSPGAGSGNVTQSNSATNTAAAGNLNGDEPGRRAGPSCQRRRGRPAPDGTGPQRHVPGRRRDGLQRPGQHLRPGHRRRRRRWLGQPGELGEQQARSAFNLNVLFQRLVQAMGMMAFRFCRNPPDDLGAAGRGSPRIEELWSEEQGRRSGQRS